MPQHAPPRRHTTTSFTSSESTTQPCVRNTPPGPPQGLSVPLAPKPAPWRPLWARRRSPLGPAPPPVVAGNLPSHADCVMMPAPRGPTALTPPPPDLSRHPAPTPTLMSGTRVLRPPPHLGRRPSSLTTHYWDTWHDLQWEPSHPYCYPPPGRRWQQLSGVIPVWWPPSAGLPSPLVSPHTLTLCYSLTLTPSLVQPFIHTSTLLPHHQSPRQRHAPRRMSV